MPHQNGRGGGGSHHNEHARHEHRHEHRHHHHHHHDKLSGHKRDSSGSVLGGSDSHDYVKLFVGSVPRHISEDQVRPLFAEYGAVLEVALIKDKRTGHQQGCCFVKYSCREEADRAIRCLNNQRTLPGGSSAVQVRYADGERERLGAVEHKLFVGCLNKQAGEKEIEQIFAPYGRVDDVYIMRDEHKKSRGCAFIKFPSREHAQGAIKGLNNIYVMRGCDQPLAVRFADPKKPKTGDSRAGGSSHSSRRGGSSGGGRSSPPASSWRGGGRALAQTQASPSFPQVGSRLSPPHHGVSPQLNGLSNSLSVDQALFSAPQALPAQRHVLLHGGSMPPQLPQIPQQQHQQLVYPPPSADQVLHLQQMQPPPAPQANFQPVLQPQFTPMQQQQAVQPTQMPIILQHQPQQQQQQQQPSVFQQAPVPQQQQPWFVALQPQLLQTQMLQSSTPPPLPPQPPAAVLSNWTEHVSPDGFKYYYNSVTAESKWDKPDALLKLEQSQQPPPPQSMSFSQLDRFRSQI